MPIPIPLKWSKNHRVRRASLVLAALVVATAGLSGGEPVTNQGAAVVAGPDPPGPRGLSVHDPSTIVKCAGEYWLFSTGPGISSRHSRDLVRWETGPRVFASPPAWTTNLVPGFRGYFWAPDVIHLDGRFLLYYSVSSWGKNTSAIGLATNATLDPADAGYGWNDQGPVCRSESRDDFNTIDPSVTQTADGSLWLAFGSFWSGIKMIQLDPATGRRTPTNSTVYSLASHATIEAPCLWQRDGFYYLFVNWGLCCRGTNSTYSIRVGRSAAITGPYLDQAGVDLEQGGGSAFLDTDGPFIGPGHAAIHTERGTNWLSCHYYDGRRGGAATLAVRELLWSTDGWPAAGANLIE